MITIAVCTRHVDANARTRAYARRVAAGKAKNEPARLENRESVLLRQAAEARQVATQEGVARERRRQVRLMQIERFLNRQAVACRSAIPADGEKADRAPHTMASVARRVCWFFDISLDVLKGECLSRDIMLARFAFCYWARQLTGKSSTTIGRFLGGRDHSSILNGAQKYPDKRRALRGRLASAAASPAAPSPAASSPIVPSPRRVALRRRAVWALWCSGLCDTLEIAEMLEMNEAQVAQIIQRHRAHPGRKGASPCG